MLLVSIKLCHWHFPSSQATVRPPVQKAKSPAPQPPGASTAPKLGPKGTGMTRVWNLYIHMPILCGQSDLCVTQEKVALLFLLAFYSPAASGFPVA